eukprot:COSAG02_NODE_8781_length_2449_cov_1.291064_1_plen_118_part_00
MLEACEIAVIIGGVLGPCGVFGCEYYRASPRLGDYVTLPGGSMYTGSQCPVGRVLAAGSSVGWTSDYGTQGGDGYFLNANIRDNKGHNDNGCHAKGLCGLRNSWTELGGGWQICFAT